MPTQIRVGGEWREPSACKVFSGGAWRNIVSIKVYSGATWRTVANFTAPGSGDTPPDESGEGGGSSGGLTLDITGSPVGSGVSPVTTSEVTATPTGGLAPYTYSWVNLTGNLIFADSPTLATTTFTGNVPVGHTRSATFQCTCTDSLGTTGSDTIAVSISSSE